MLDSWSKALLEHPLPWLQWGVVVVAGLVAATTDLHSRRIPNWLTGPLALAGLLQAAIIGGLPAVADSATACVLLALPYVLLFVLAGGGAGDAKFMGAVGTWLGLVLGAGTLVSICLCGVVLALVWAASRNRLVPALSRVGALVCSIAVPVFQARLPRYTTAWIPLPEDSEKMPYGAAIALGILVSALLQAS
jgi:prepilin peptidase CpaA